MDVKWVADKSLIKDMQTKMHTCPLLVCVHTSWTFGCENDDMLTSQSLIYVTS